MAREFGHMLSPIDVGPVRMRNRVYFAPHDTNFMPPNTPPNDRAIAYYAARARGGVAAVVTPNLLGVTATGASLPERTLTNVAACEDYARCVAAIHEHEAKVVAQLAMVGRLGQTRPQGGITMSASAVRVDFAPFTREMPRAMGVEDIREVVELYASAARTARLAGFDGLEIAGAGGLLLHQFLSPVLNKRTDGYGASVEGRMRLPLEVIEAVRREAGPNMIVGYKLPGDDFRDGGIDVEQAKRIAVALEDTGNIDYLTVVGGMYVSVPTHVPPMYYPLGCFVYLASQIRSVVRRVAVNCMGRVNDPAQVDSIIAEHHADMVGMVRGLICDPDFVKKARDGRTDEIRQCVGCEEGCYGRFRRGLPITCAYNPEAGREAEMTIEHASAKKKVMIIGGGVAGLEAARVAAARGHSVSIYEKEKEIGGQLRLAAKAPRRDDFEQIPRYYAYQAGLHDIEMHLDVEVDRELVDRTGPDAVIVATGSVPRVLDVPVSDDAHVLDVRSVLNGEPVSGENIVVVAGEHGMEALTVADFLSERGKFVTVVTEFFYAGSEAPFGVLQAVYTRLLRKGVSFATLSAISAIRANMIVLRNVFTGQESTMEQVDTVVSALGSDPRDALAVELRESGYDVWVVGDCRQARFLPQVTFEAAQVARWI